MGEDQNTLEGALVNSFGADLARDIVDEIRVGWERDKVLAQVRQNRIAEATQKLERCTVDGLGQHTASIDLTSFLYWSNRTGGQCWKDDGFFKEFLRDNPACRVKYKQRHLALTVQGLRKPSVNTEVSAPVNKMPTGGWKSARPGGNKIIQP